MFTNHWRAGDDELCPPELIIMRMSSDVSRWGQFFQGDFGNNPVYKAASRAWLTALLSLSSGSH